MGGGNAVTWHVPFFGRGYHDIRFLFLISKQPLKHSAR